ncbi:MAG TPA: methionyl-tRNA formyltransferase, partial [Leptospiraceae bacterium]|nr:methionyl-tRNA formyltransferase [Leptospiraceae bacterium]
MGTPEISAELLKALLEAGHKLEFVVSNPDRPKGRSGTPLPSAVSEVALENQLNLLRPEK